MVEPRRAVESMVRYLTARPDEITRFIRSGLGMRLGVPLAAFRWILAEVTRDLGMDAELDVDPPGLRFAGTIEKMNTRMRIHAGLFVQDILIDDHQIRLTLRVEGLRIDVISEQKTQLSALLRSGALDLSRPGDLVNELPNVPPVVVHAQGTRIELDLMRSGRFEDSRLRELVGALSALVTVKDIRTESSDHVDVTLRTLPRGPATATQALKTAVIKPGIARARSLAKRLLRRTPPGRFLLSGGPDA